MLQRVTLHGALRLEDVAIHGPAVQEASLRVRDPVLQEVTEAELDGGGEDPVVRAHAGEGARVFREAVVIKVGG
eukprot:11978830-Alexandrium_andersonii.AAC.1